MIPFLLIAAACIPLGSIALDMRRDSRRTTPTVVVAKHRADNRPVMGQPAAPLPQRPDGRAALKAEIRQAEEVDVLLVPAPPVQWQTSGKQHDDWQFSTGEYQALVEWHFAGEPTDQAVIRHGAVAA